RKSRHMVGADESQKRGEIGYVWRRHVVEALPLILRSGRRHVKFLCFGWCKFMSSHLKLLRFEFKDFTEVDNNVTRHIPNELRRRDWHTMVMHYLGLDHIGHKSGPRR